jgi:hypothetical protein
MAKRKPRRPRPRTRFLTFDGELHLIVERRPAGVVTTRLRGAQLVEVVRALDDAQYDLAAGILGHRRPPR